MSLHSLLSCVPQSCLIKMFLHIMMPNCMTSSLLVPFLSSSLTLPHCHDATLYGIFTLGLLLAFFPIVITVDNHLLFQFYHCHDVKLYDIFTLGLLAFISIVMMPNCMTSSSLVSFLYLPHCHDAKLSSSPMVSFFPIVMMSNCMAFSLLVSNCPCC